MKSNSGMRRTGGGINSRVNVSPGVRNGAPATGVRPAGVSQFGSSGGNHATGSGKVLRGGAERYATATPGGGNQRLGNAVAASTVCGVGGSRTVMRSGSQQGTTQQPKPMSPGRDILGAYGPESKPRS